MCGCVGVVLTVGTMSFGRRTVPVFAVGLLFGYVLAHIAISALYGRSNVALHSSVPLSPHSHGELDRSVPELSDIQQWHDFGESSHVGMCTLRQ